MAAERRENMPTSKYTAEDIIRIVQEEDVRFIRLQFTDIFGSFKNIAITANQLEKRLIIMHVRWFFN